MDEWPFDQEPDAAAITTRQVLRSRFPILTVVHYADDHSWAFVCGTTRETKDGRVISMDDALRIDPTLASIADLPPGWVAKRSKVGAPWSRAPDPGEQPAEHGIQHDESASGGSAG